MKHRRNRSKLRDCTHNCWNDCVGTTISYSVVSKQWTCNRDGVKEPPAKEK